MRARRNILSTLLLMLILIGGGGVFTKHLSLCMEATCAALRHDCCHCEAHDDVCDTHRFVLDHECKSGDKFIDDYIISSSHSTLRLLNRAIISGVSLSYTAAPQGVGHEAIRAIITSIRNREPWRDDYPHDLFDPSTDALRAPPVLV